MHIGTDRTVHLIVDSCPSMGSIVLFVGKSYINILSWLWSKGVIMVSLYFIRFCMLLRLNKRCLSLLHFFLLLFLGEKKEIKKRRKCMYTATFLCSNPWFHCYCLFFFFIIFWWISLLLFSFSSGYKIIIHCHLCIQRILCLFQLNQTDIYKQ